MLKEKTSNFYLLVETSNYIINQMSIKYFRLWKNEKIKQVPHQELALEYGVAESTISGIIARLSWTHI